MVAKSFTARLDMLKSHRLADTSDDMGKVLNKSGRSSVFAFTEEVNKAIDRMKIDTTQIFATDRNPKVIKRFIQFIHGVNAKDYKAIDNTTATIIYALQVSGVSGNALNVDALHYIAAGVKAGKIAPETRGVSRTAINKLFGRVGLSTIPTQASRTVGKNGFLQLAGATAGEPGKQNQKVTLNSAHPLIVAFNDCMNAATESQIEEMVGE